MKNENDEQVENMEDLPELASLSNRFNYFENFNDDTGDSRKKSKDESHEAESARRECKASSVLNKFKEMENKVLNGEDDGKFRTEFLKFTLTAVLHRGFQCPPACASPIYRSLFLSPLSLPD